MGEARARSEADPTGRRAPRSRTWSLGCATIAAVWLLFPLPGTAGPAEDCLDERIEPRRGIAACNQAEAVIRFRKDTMLSNPAGDPLLTPDLRTTPERHAIVLAARGGHRYRAGDPKRAIEDLDAALARDPGNAALLARRGLAKEAEGQPQSALHDFRRALRYDPAQDVARQGVARLEARLPPQPAPDTGR